MNVRSASERPVPFAELIDLHNDLAAQLDSERDLPLVPAIQH
ncbi:hypothetical protein [Curtobacterium sp. MCBD17_013]|nr:hypothetical protein [Curtobacterium sp. MCBD17_013]